jgi:hypothetical protein
MKLSPVQRHILRAMVDGATLKAHRTLDGEKVHRLHPLSGAPEVVDARVVESLRELGLIQSNLKFPAATYVLTERGLEQSSHQT